MSKTAYTRRTPPYVAPRTDSRPTEYVSPSQVEKRLAELDWQISVGVSELAARHKVFIGLKNEVEIETARAYMAFSGAAHAKKYAAILATEDLRNDLAVAETAYQFARWKLDSLREQVSCVQSIGASFRATIEIAGRGAA